MCLHLADIILTAHVFRREDTEIQKVRFQIQIITKISFITLEPKQIYF